MSEEDNRQTAALRAKFEVETEVEFWGRACRVTPRVVGAVFGDGAKLIGLAAIMYRPNYFLVQVDSSWGLHNSGPEPLLIDHMHEIYAAIEDEFPEWPWADDYHPDPDDESRRTSFDGGSCWWLECDTSGAAA